MSDLFDDTVLIPAVEQQLFLFHGMDNINKDSDTFFSAPEIELDTYDKIIITVSTGKDSLACLLHLIDCGIDVRSEKVELWHNCVDGREGSTLFDWPFIESYAEAIANHFGVKLYFSWLQGGLEGEMLKNNSYSRPHIIETPKGMVSLERDTKRAKPGTRLKFPQQSGSLTTRYCSSVAKIDLSRRALNNQERFNHSKILYISGERRLESSPRSKMNQLEKHACDRRGGTLKRHVDHWRPVLHWTEEQVWDALKRHRVIAPVPYRLNFSRSSCQMCIFNSPRIWATLLEYFPDRVKRIAEYEKQFGTTISRKKISVLDIAKSSTPFLIEDTQALEQAVKTDYQLPVIQGAGDWVLPAGAFSQEPCGSL